MKQKETCLRLFKAVKTCRIIFEDGSSEHVTIPEADGIVSVQFIKTEPNEIEEKAAFIEALHQNLYNSLDTSDFAKKCGYSCMRNFTRHFRKYIGNSPYRWMAEKKVEDARPLVLLTNISLKAIAQKQGFTRFATFERHYAMRFGIKPEEDRKNEQTAHICR